MIELENGRRYLFQWDQDKRIIIDGYPAGTRVEFSQIQDCKSSALLMVSYAENGHVYADIPNILLKQALRIRALVCPSASDPAHSPQEREIKVVRREKPDDYIYRKTESLTFDGLDQRIKNLEESMDGGADFITDETLSLKNGILSVNTADEAAEDNTLPITSAAVHTQLGNIETLLKTI